jgi:hypothetical protein
MERQRKIFFNERVRQQDALLFVQDLMTTPG